MPGLSNWREEFNLSEVVTGKMTDKEALKKVSEKSGINNKVTINPKLDEAVKEIGGEVIGMVEQDTTAQKQRIDMKQMILDRQKLKIRRKDLSAAKKEQQNDVEGDSTNASKQSNVIAQEETEVKEGVMKMVKKVMSKKKPEKKAEKAMDAGARAKRLLARKIHAKYVSGSEDNVPDDIREASAVLDANKKLEKEKKTKKDKAQLAKLVHIYKGMKKGIYSSYELEGELIEGDVHSGQGEKIQKRTKAWMDKKGMKGAPGLDAMKARTAEHQAKRGVKEEIVTEADPRLAYYQSGITDASRVKGRVGKAVDKVKDKVKKVLGKKDKVSSHLDRYRFQSGLDNYLKSKVKKEEVVIDERTLSSYIPSDRQGEARRANLDYTKAQLKKKEDQSTKNRGDLSKRDAGKMAKERLRTKKIMSMGEGEDKAFNFVRNKLKAKYGDGVLTTGEKMKPPTAAQKKAAAAHREKIAKQQAAEFKKDPSQGRYPKGYSNRGSD